MAGDLAINRDPNYPINLQKHNDDWKPSFEATLTNGE